VGGAANAAALAQGTYSQAGGSTIVLGDILLGSHDGTANAAARGTLNITGGTFTVGGNISKAGTTRSSSIINVNGGTLDLQNQAHGDTTKGTFSGSQLTFRAGSIVDAESVTLDGVSVTSGTVVGDFEDALILRDVTVDFDVFLTHVTAGLGGILYESAGGGSGGVINGDVDLGGVDRDITVQNNASAAADLTVAGQVSNAGILNKLGAGTLVLSHANNNYGSTTVSEGTLQVGLNGVGTTGLGVTFVAQNATLAGSGTVTAFNPAVTTHIVEGNLSPGDLGGAAVGNLKFQGNLSLDATAVTTIQLGSPTTPGVTYDQITGVSSNDTIILDGSINAAEAGDGFFGGYVGAAGDTWQILMDWTTLNLASFNVGTNMRTGVDGLDEGDLDLPTLGAGLFWDVSNFATNGSVQISAVPEPGRALLLLLGAAGLVLRRRRVER
jgi:fibronectin-binding autotransporter adhesin